MNPDHKGSGEPGRAEADKTKEVPNQGVSTPEPAEGSDDYPPPEEGSPKG